MIVSPAFAQNYFRRELRWGKKTEANASEWKPVVRPWREIVGVVAMFYIQATQREDASGDISSGAVNSRIGAACIRVVRTSLDPMSSSLRVRHLVIHPWMAIFRSHRCGQCGTCSLCKLSQPRLAPLFFSCPAHLPDWRLILTLFGLYALMIGTRLTEDGEIGVRLALGAPAEPV